MLLGQRLISGEMQLTELQLESTLEGYLVRLDKVEAHDRDNTAPQPSGDGDAPDQTTNRGDGNEGAESTPVGATKRRARDMEEEDEVELYRACKRPNPSLYAWAAESFLREMVIDPGTWKTLELIREYSKDIKYARDSLTCTIGAPEFPKGEWLNVLAGNAVDLDHVLTGEYSSTAERKEVGKVGSLEFTIPSTTPKQKVRDSSEWLLAWQKTLDAVSFAFPHRKLELQLYRQSIFRQFKAIASQYHGRVIEFDRAIRKRTSTPSTLIHVEQILPEALEEEAETPVLAEQENMLRERLQQRKLVTGGMQGNVTKPESSVASSTTTPNVDSVPIPHVNAPLRDMNVRRPCYRRNWIWAEHDGYPRQMVAQASLSLPPIPEVPEEEKSDFQVTTTLDLYSHLFTVITPINVDRFESLLESHPNQPFVKSVCHALREGFWPWANTMCSRYPTGWEELRPPPVDEHIRQFLRD
ncbi:uncharacterized protein FIBRA_09085 [Fibroporia radiculosa]|uniref:Uncharacterized protein n=1 Tax=Fibroporia radiculosa TaxID=599839 RepID=J4ICP8_9APHY|nr:uncharacterized protein FIBRA_09085 [Fibroporia radiculosa]CCM06786.1 predicted protein [Fibroporia radiculosa]